MHGILFEDTVVSMYINAKTALVVIFGQFLFRFVTAVLTLQFDCTLTQRDTERYPSS